MQTEPIGFIDFEALRRHVSSYEFLFDRLIELFLEQAPLWLQELDGAFAGQNPALVRQVCHKIKGSAATLHASCIIEAASELSLHAVNGNLRDAGQSRARLVAAIRGTVAFARESGHIKSEC